MRVWYACSILVFVFSSCSKQQGSGSQHPYQTNHSLASELKTFYDISTLPQYFENTFSAQVSSYDTTWKNDDGFNGKYSFLKRNADSSLVIFDVKGSGVIHRIWTPTPTEDTLDFFIDKDTVTFSIKFSDLFSGRQFPFIAPLCGNQLGGFYCYLPIPFEKSCKIVARAKRIQFHQFQYRLYESGATVQSFELNLNEDEKEALKNITTLWNKKTKSLADFYQSEVSKSTEQIELKPESTTTIFRTREGGRVLGIEIEPSQIFEGLHKDVVIRITWDDEKYPAVCCPVADFFGYAFGRSSMQSLLLGTEAEKSYCYFPMPFDKEAKIELINRSSTIKNLSVNVWYSANPRIAEREGKFYAFWNKNVNPPIGKPHVFLDVQGKGHYVGTILQAQGLKAGMTIFFEGDDSTAIDGDFRMHGTGSEDYFNGGWYAMLDRWDSKLSLPLHGALDYSLPFARTGGYRLFLTDKLSFEKNLFHSIEHGPVGNRFPVDYTSLALYYADSPSTQVIEPAPKLTEVFIPDTLIVYPQLMDFNFAEDIDVKTSWKYGTGGESYLFAASNESWMRISLAGIPHGLYELTFDVQKKVDGCEFSVWQRQTQISDWISTYQKEEEHVKNLHVCDIDINDFKNAVTIRFRIKDPMRSLLLHRITLIKNQKESAE